MIRENLNWIVAVTMVIVAVGGISVYVSTDKFEVMLADGSIKAKYAEGVLKIYSGRYLAFNDDIRPYYWNGEGYITMYKARGDKYSNISYYKEDDIIYIKQDIYYSQGILTRHFSIDENDIKASFEWTPEDPKLRVYFRWNFDGMDEIPEKIVYLDSKNKNTHAEMDFGILNVWKNELENTVRVERFQNGRLTIRTKIFEGKAFYDPALSLSSAPRMIDSCKTKLIEWTEEEPVYGPVQYCRNTSIIDNKTQENVTVVDGFCWNQTEVIKINIVPYSRIEEYDCETLLKIGTKDINPLVQNFNCSGENIVYCDSCLDGNCDGVCDSRGGESCCMIDEKGNVVCKNSVVEWKPTIISVERIKIEA